MAAKSLRTSALQYNTIIKWALSLSLICIPTNYKEFYAESFSSLLIVCSVGKTLHFFHIKIYGQLSNQVTPLGLLHIFALVKDFVFQFF